MAEAYKEAEKTLSHRIKAMLLGSLPEDDSDIDERTKYATAFGSIVEPLAAQEESFKEVIEETTELFARYFFKKVTNF